MTRRTLLCECAGVVEAPPERVGDALAARLLPSGVADTGDGTYRLERLTVEIDRERRFFAAQGGWWYRGEYVLTAHPSGTRVAHGVYNVAQWTRWAVPLANRFFVGFREQTRDGFAEGLRDLAARLGCAARPE
jgi:hypothetical protein